jgi:hypothetical protein
VVKPSQKMPQNSPVGRFNRLGSSLTKRDLQTDKRHGVIDWEGLIGRRL